MKALNLEIVKDNEGKYYFVATVSGDPGKVYLKCDGEGLPPMIEAENFEAEKRREKIRKASLEQKAKEDKLQEEMEKEFKRLESEKFEKLQAVREKISKKVGL